MIDIRQYTNLLHTINTIINNRGVAEVKVEEWKDGIRLLVVEQNRSVKAIDRIKK